MHCSKRGALSKLTKARKKASNVASNSDVPAPFMVDRIYTAAFSSPQELLVEFEKVYLLGQSQRQIFNRAVEYAIGCQHISAVENLFKLDVSRVRHLSDKDIDVNAIEPNVLGSVIQGERADVDALRLLLDLGLDVRKTFGSQGDALMLAVRIGRWELVERILDQRGSFDVDEVKVSQIYHFPRCVGTAGESAYSSPFKTQYHKYDRKFTLLSVASDRIRVADELHHYGAHDAEEIPIWADQKRVILELLNRGASIRGTCLLPNLAADPQRKEQTVAFARMLIEEYGAEVQERYERDSVMHRRWGREPISTALYEAVRNNFPSMVELLLEKGADRTVKGHRGMTLVECAWNNKHTAMVQLLRERGAPEGPKTKGKDVSMLRSSTPSRAAIPYRNVRSDSSGDEMDPEDRRMMMYRAIRP